MNYLNEQLLKSLKEARKRKGLSQRELSTKSGVPQSHISKIENGGVDLRVSSLIALARVLDLELALVPRKTVPAVKSIVRSTTNADMSATIKKANFAMNQLQETAAKALATSAISKYNVELDSIERLKAAVLNASPSAKVLEEIQRMNKKLESALTSKTDLQKALESIDANSRALRNQIAHMPKYETAVSSAYQVARRDDD